jgi:hypothetical protein
MENTTRKVGRPKGPEKVLFRKRLSRIELEHLERLLDRGLLDPEGNGDMEALIADLMAFAKKDEGFAQRVTKELEEVDDIMGSVEVQRLQARIRQLEDKIKEYESMYRGS